MNLLSVFLPPVIGALIGYSTNWLAITMLFRPHRALYLFGRRLPFTPGLIPKEQARLARKVAATIGGRILTPELIARELVSPPILAAMADSLKTAIRGNLPQAADFIKQFEHPRIDEEGPELIKKLINEHVGRLAGIFLDPQKIFTSVKEGIIEYISQEENLGLIADKLAESIDKAYDYVPDGLLEKVAAQIARHIDVEGLIESQINGIQPEEAETLIMSVVRRELHMVMALGGVLGFIIGWIPVLFY